MKNYYKNYYTSYYATEDKTIIFAETWKDTDLLTVEIAGFHYGEPDEHSFEYIGKCKAYFKGV